MKKKSVFKIALMDSFPDFNVPDFDEKVYNSRFENANVIIRAKAKEVFYPDHWTCLSLKSAFRGYENYQGRNSCYSVGDSCYLLLDEGTVYRSFIDSRTEVESFTVNFTPAFVGSAVQTRVTQDQKMMDDPMSTGLPEPVRFTEKLCRHHGSVSDLIFRMRRLSSDWTANQARLEELYFDLLEALMDRETGIRREMQQVDAIRTSTKQELYKRLHRAKDYMDSCFSADLSLGDMAGIACMNEHHFLRRFKSLFHCTPYRYLQDRRLQEAEVLLKKSNFSVTEVCERIGYSDLASFSKLFKRKYSRSPLDFRNGPDHLFST